MKRSLSTFLSTAGAEADEPTLELALPDALPPPTAALECWLQRDKLPSVVCRMFDLSEYGVRLLAERQVEVGARGMLRVFAPEGIVRFRVEITWSRPYGFGSELGARISTFRGSERSRFKDFVRAIRKRARSDGAS